MFGSLALETTIGLALVFFVVASLASAIVEGTSRLLRKRARDLEQTIGQMLSGSTTFDDAAEQALKMFKGTSIYASADMAASRGRRWFRKDVGPAYLSARSFADAIDELTDRLTETPVEGVNKRLKNFRTDGETLALDAKAALENWYDETMGRLSGAYKRWATGVLFLVGLGLAVAGNVSAFHTAQTLWQQPAVRQAALDAAEQAAVKSTTGDGLVTKNVQTVQDLAGLGMPVGWEHGTHWSDAAWTVSHVAGWLVTALLLMLGAPFWFDVLSRLVSLRTTGAKPPAAAQDPGAATSLRAAAVSSAAGAAAVAEMATAESALKTGPLS
ncbi:hypothetical protein [Paractinoplanes toevensis]|uniref:Uncharacterized protein n=1 Tax=Paractinoplanes toevensis TaxID=571911 RepID=A0A919THT4_9ACTN|nr:hypothetical protein [Actinoplanes toevensis]GIM95457.1 hypothetical protein Ato02nite_072500 [Actinoplanes toevensis]